MDENPLLDAFKAFLENYQKKSNTTCTHDVEKTSGSSLYDQSSKINRQSSNSPIASEIEDMPIHGYTMEMYTSKSKKYTKAKQKFRVSC